MKLTVDPEKQQAICEKNRIKLLILHGSYAKGVTTPQSDIDIGVLCQAKLDHKQYLALLGDLHELFGDKCDPVFLNRGEPMINYHVAIHGKLLYEATQGDFAQFKVQSIAKYMDAKKFRELEKHYIKRAIGKEPS